ncbi:MAG: response regulator, partial [Janthinobacterium sp.]
MNSSAIPFDLENSPRILLVDDEPRLLASLHELLKDRGYQLYTATCGSEALAQLSKLRFDLILLDLRLPDMS